MISLSRHIELLLLDHNCVIVPGLGGFIANTASAVYNDGPEGDKLFMPPYRTIGFNPQLQVNDGLLVQSYMQAYDASYPAAYLQMEKDIEQLNIQLSLCGTYTLEGIGTLHKSLDNGILLSSPEAGILTPSLYGTYSFGIRSLAEVMKERQKQTAADQTNIMPIQTEGDFKAEQKEEKKVIAIKRKDQNDHKYWYDFAIAAAAAVIIFMAFLIPNMKTLQGEQETYIAGTIATNNSAKDKTTTSNTISTSKPVKATTKTDKTADIVATKKVTDTPKQPEEVQSVKDYTIVLASFVSEKNSNILINKLAEEGFTEAQFVKKGKTTRIIYSSYTTEQEATNALLELRKQNDAFAEAWTMKIN